MKASRNSDRVWGALCICLGGLISYPVWQQLVSYVATGSLEFHSRKGLHLYGADAAIPYVAYLLIGLACIAYGLSLLLKPPGGDA